MNEKFYLYTDGFFANTAIVKSHVDHISWSKAYRHTKLRPIVTIPWWKCLWYKHTGRKIPWKPVSGDWPFNNWVKACVTIKMSSGKAFYITFPSNDKAIAMFENLKVRLEN